MSLDNSSESAVATSPTNVEVRGAEQVVTAVNPGHGPVILRSLSDIHPSPENDTIYRPVTADDEEVQALADSIRASGVLEPIALTTDDFILSGHRRFAAAQLAGLTVIPCRTEPVSRREDHDAFMRRLCEYNRQRTKTNAERLREEIVSIDAENAYEELIAYRTRKSELMLEAMEIEGEVKRHNLTRAKEPFLNAVKKVLKERRTYWPLSDRQIHYALLNDPPLKHASKPDSVYRNDKSSYKALVDLVTRARLARQIPMQAIADETRPVCEWEVYRATGPFVADQIGRLMRGYHRDLLQSQTNQIEILGEKNTVSAILKPVAGKYGIPLTTGRGYCSIPPRADMAKRFKKSGREKLVLLIVSDFDPDGEEIAQSFARSMRDDFSIANVEAIKVALTEEQVGTYGLIPNMTAKCGSANFKKFTRRYGNDVFELEALDPRHLQNILDTAIRSVLDVDAFNLEVEREKQDSAFLEGVRRRITEDLRGLSLAEGEGGL